MNVCFLMYPWESIEPDGDSTLTLIHECLKRGHKVAIATPANLTIRNSVAYAFCKLVSKGEKFSNTPRLFYKTAKLREKMLPLAGFDVIFMRANPPLDPIVLNFLDSVKEDAFIVNDVEGLREANNKIALSNISSLLDFYIDNKDGTSNYVILQDYIPGADQGDVRVLLLGGEPIGAIRRVPGDDDHRSNLSAGGSFKKHSLTKQEKALCKKIAPKLRKDGLHFVGIDVINGMLVEVNVMSPGGINYINKVQKTRLQEKVIDYIEAVVSERQKAFDRKDLSAANL